MVLAIQIAGILFGLFMIYYSFLNFKKKEFTAKEFTFWLVFWILFVVFTLVPYILDPIAKSLNFARTFDLLVISGFIFLMLAIFYTYTVTRKTQKKVETIVRTLAMEKNKGK